MTRVSSVTKAHNGLSQLRRTSPSLDHTNKMCSLFMHNLQEGYQLENFLRVRCLLTLCTCFNMIILSKCLTITRLTVLCLCGLWMPMPTALLLGAWVVAAVGLGGGDV